MARCGHMAGPRKPTWMPTCCLHGVNSDIRQSGSNRAIGRSGLNCAIGQLKSHGVESASWATIPPITRDLTAEITRSEIHVIATIPLILRDPTAEITRSEIRVVGHDPPILHKLLYK